MDDITSSVSESDKAAVSTKLPTNYTVGTYLDINLWKQISGDAASKVTKTANGTVKIGFTIPESLQKSGRTYNIIRLHDGVATLIEPSVDANYELTFETDSFSTYALVYTDSTASSSTETSATTTSSPKTGETSNMAGYLVILMLGFAGFAFYKKRQNI